MNFKKIVSCMAAAAMSVAALGVTASAEDISVNAVLGFADMGWCHQDWEAAVEVTGDGTYTITSTTVAGAEDFGVFVIDLQGMYAEYPEATATLDKVEVDGAEISVDASKIMYGDIEEKGNYRIDIYNQYSDTAKDPGVNQATAVAESVSVTFTVSGLGGAAPAEEEAAAEEVVEEVVEEAPVADTTTTPAATGNTTAAAIAVVMVAAGAAAVVSKRK